MNTQRGILNRLKWMQEEYGLEAGEGVLQKTPMSFDVSVWEFYWPLMVGGRLVLARPEGHRDSGYLVGLIKEKGITTVHFVPSMLEVLLSEEGLEGCCTLKRVICSGEALPLELMKKFYEQSEAGLHNLYGPTEAAVDVTSWVCEAGKEGVRIGRPISNIRTYVLDDLMELSATGVVGELYLGGVGVGRGYLGRGDMTAETYVPEERGVGERIYRTGDTVRWRAEEEIEYVGRKDQQVKIRGYRIELGEIEEVLRERAEVREAVVLARESGAGELRLIGYVVGEEGREVNVRELGAYAKGKLPGYMAPVEYVVMERMPLTANGKIDRRGLPPYDVNRRRSEEEYVAPRTLVEEILCGIWRDLLHIDRIGVNDNFFNLGGHSLLATRVLSRILDSLNVELSLQAIFDTPTIEGLAVAVVQTQAQQADMDVLAEMLDELDSISKDDIQAILAKERPE
jgi:acyl-coenzyme A synthetase/AMP-(fatty) acid ligase